MSNPTGSTPWSPPPPGGSHGGDPAPPKRAADHAGLVNEPVQRTTIPLKIMIASLIALVVTVGAVAFIATQTTKPGAVSTRSLTPEPTGPPELPIQAGGYARMPGNPTAAPEFGVDPSLQTASAHFLLNGQPALLAVAARPVDDPKVLFDQIRVRAQRQVGEGWCGREASNDLDVCIVKRGRTAVVTMGLSDQTPDELISAAREILLATR